MDRIDIRHFDVTLEDTVYHVCLEGGFFEAEPQSAPLHNHADFEVHFIQRGQIVFRLDGARVPLDSGAYCLIPPYMYHAIEHSAGGSRRLCFRFRLSAAAAGARKAEALFGGAKGFCVHTAGVRQLDILESILAEYRDRQTGYLSGISSLLTLLLLSLVRDISRCQSREVGSRSSYAEENRTALIDGYFARCYTGDVHIGELAQELSVSTRQLERIMMRYYGVTFKQKLTEIRVYAAQNLLKTTDMTVMQVAGAVGYNNIRYFVSAFKRITDQTPEQYRKSAGE